MKKRENQRIAMTKLLLKRSLFQLMAEKSINSITVSELCEKAEVNRTTFYNHYGCPADVLKEVEAEIIADVEKLLKPEKPGKTLSVEKQFEALCDYLLEHKRIAKLLFKDSDIDSEFASMLIKVLHIRSASQQALSNIKDDEVKQLMITFLNAGVYHVIRKWILDDMSKSPKEIGALAGYVATHGWKNLPNRIAEMSQKNVF